MASEKTKPLDTIALVGSVSKGSQIQCTSRACSRGSTLETITHDGLNWERKDEKKAPLGIATRTSSPTLKGAVIDPATGEIIPKEKKRDHQSARADRWAFKSVVNKLLPGSRTSDCMKLRAPVTGQSLGDIQVCKGKNFGKAFYQGLMACGSIWTCPVCAAKISERRRKELTEALEVAKHKDLAIHFVTLTFPHGAGDDLNEILTKLTKAYGKLSNGKHSVKNQLKQKTGETPEYAYHGFIRALEVTHGKNGFHPHIHMIVFTGKAVGTGLMQYVYGQAWKRACRLAGLPEPNQHGCTVKDGSFAAEYVSKWGIEDEMTKANTKLSKNKGMTPWGFLRAIIDNDDPVYTPEKSKNLFLVYSNAFKGKRQLYWSNGLRKFLQMSKEMKDAEIISAPDEEEALVLSEITFDQWKKIRFRRQEPYILNVAESNSAHLKTFIQNICDGVTNSQVGIKKTQEQKRQEARQDNALWMEEEFDHHEELKPIERGKYCPVCGLSLVKDSCPRCKPKAIGQRDFWG